jgi:TldD protein
VALAACTIVDDGTLAGRRGSLTSTTRARPRSCTTLIEDGVLRGYLQDKLNARLMGVRPPATAAASFAHLPMPRMTNTYMLRAARSGEIIASVSAGSTR